MCLLRLRVVQSPVQCLHIVRTDQCLKNDNAWETNLNQTKIFGCLFNLLRLCRTADKILLKAKDEVLNGDEEQAYVLYMRFVDVYKCIRASKEYKRDKRELVKLLPSSKAVKAVDEAERLSQSLKDR